MDFTDIDQVITALYTAISGPAGEQDWALEEQLLHPDARLVRTRVDAEGRPLIFAFDPAGYRAATEPMLAAAPFFEIETARKLFVFGNIAQAFSAYEARDAAEGGALLFRGINLIHLVHDGARWWVMHVIWDNEREGVEIPEAAWWC